MQAAAPAPDLVVTRVDWSPTALVGGQAVTFRATIKNVGSATTPAGVKHGVQFQVGGVLKTWSDSFTGPLAPGGSVTVQANGGPSGATWSATAGSPVVTAFVDDALRIEEGVETNNKLTRTATVAAGISSRLRGTAHGVVATTSVPASTRATGLVSSLTGSVYGACYQPGGIEVPGTEKWLLEHTLGNDEYTVGGPFSSSGKADAPAGTRPVQVTSALLDFIALHKWNYGLPAERITCPAGATAGFSRFQGHVLTTRQFVLNPYPTPNALVSTYSAPVEVDVQVR